MEDLATKNTATTSFFMTIETNDLALVTGGDWNGVVDWLKEKGTQIINHFFPPVSAQGQAQTPGGNAQVQFSYGDAPRPPQLPPLPPLHSGK